MIICVRYVSSTLPLPKNISGQYRTPRLVTPRLPQTKELSLVRHKRFTTQGLSSISRAILSEINFGLGKTPSPQALPAHRAITKSGLSFVEGLWDKLSGDRIAIKKKGPKKNKGRSMSLG
ncbi:uncharacterized protein H6S33_003782 [Morchella sextelata]|uniref:uncharacterized protein n=1 Tax=Morchella sextelata TaxID=1174677 RepID=UPI001D042958|nr:uncharacterized protein H6S33_003782 [Morchella sextelata]KAH0606121.1 hypothetical protein H6S33_003782 [Morchella sextelata]